MVWVMRRRAAKSRVNQAAVKHATFMSMPGQRGLRGSSMGST
jgi:hypothetical protein